jgi:hypothetical protein
MIRRFREGALMKQIALLVPALLTLPLGLTKEPVDKLQFQFSFMRIELAPGQPAFTVLTVDSLGSKKLTGNPLRAAAKPDKAYEVRGVGQTYEWKSWDGPPHGYEGLLVDNYQALLAVLSR